MLDKIYQNQSIPKVNFQGSTVNNQKVNQYTTTPSFKAEADGLNALATYNTAIMNKPYAFENLEIHEHTPVTITPDTISSLGGEEIFSSDGKRIAVIKKDQFTTTIYKFDRENPDKLSSVVKKENQTGKVIKEQINKTEKGPKYRPETEIISIYEYDRKGKEIACTTYEDGEFCHSSRTYYKPNEVTTIIGKTSDGNYYIDENSPKTNTSRSITLDKNKCITNYYENKDINNRHISKNAQFYNGALISVSTNEETSIPNSMGKSEVNTPELKPAENFIPSIDYKGHEGEKTYYSDNSIETNTFNTAEGQVKAFFDPDGTLAKISINNKEIEFDKNNVKITENLSTNKKKITDYNNGKLENIRYEADRKYKEIYYSENQLPTRYGEGSIDSDGFDSHEHSIGFNDDGMVQWAY